MTYHKQLLIIAALFVYAVRMNRNVARSAALLPSLFH